MQLKDATIKGTLKAATMAKLPFAVDNAKRHILVWRPGSESYYDRIGVPGIFLDVVGGALGFVQEIRVEYVELVPLHDFWRKVVVVEMGLIVLVPFISSVNPINVLGLAGTVFV